MGRNIISSHTTVTHFADICPFSLLSTESVDHIEKAVHAANPDKDRLKFDYRRYRPNLLVSGVKRPFDEDEWAYVKIGHDVVLKTVCLIPRCQRTTTDPEDGTRADSQGEPLKTLFKIR